MVEKPHEDLEGINKVEGLHEVVDVVDGVHEVEMGGMIDKENSKVAEVKLSKYSKVKVKKIRKVLTRKDTNKTLQEDEAHNIKKFREKIIEDGSGFICNSCEFVSANKVLAKTHAINCGKRQPKRRKRYNALNCTDCDKTFTFKNSLNKHFKETHVTASYVCSSCGYKNSSRKNLIKHLRVHDKRYTPGFECDFCAFKAKDSWHLDRHKLSHFKATNVKDITAPLNSLSAMSFAISLTEVQIGDQCTSMYEMTVTKSGHEAINGAVDWKLTAENIVRNFNQLGLNELDWNEWLEISDILGLGPFEGCMSWVDHVKDEEKEIFKICTQEKLDTKMNCKSLVEELLKDEHKLSEFIDNITQEVYDNVPGDEGIGVNEVAVEIAQDIDNPGIRNQKNSGKFVCQKCEKSFKDKAHLTEHMSRMHTDPTPCKICNVVFPDKYSSVSHQKTCMRRCHFDHCNFQSKHKHTFLKHLRGHEQMLRRF